MTCDLDGTDLNILELLGENSRRPNAEIARELGLAESTVRKRIERMLQAGIFRSVIVPDLDILGLNGHFIAGIHVEIGLGIAVADRLGSLCEVRFVAMTTGAFDIVIEVLLPAMSDFLDFVENELSRIPGIKGIETSTVLHHANKSSYNWIEMLRRSRQ